MPTLSFPSLFTCKSSRYCHSSSPSSTTHPCRRSSVDHYTHLSILSTLIPLLRREILNLQTQIQNHHHNLQTIRRCIQVSLPPFIPPPVAFTSSYHPNTNMDTDPDINLDTKLDSNYEQDLHLALKILSLRPFPKPSSSPTRVTTCPSIQIDKPCEYRPDEIRIPLPTTLSTEDLDGLMMSRDSCEEVKVDLLVLKRAELEVERDGLEGEVVFWGSVWEGVKLEQDLVVEERREMHLSTEQGCSISQPISRTRRIRRKEVPVREMLGRVRREQGGVFRKGEEDSSSVIQSSLVSPMQESSVVPSSSRREGSSEGEEEKGRHDSGIDLEFDEREEREMEEAARRFEDGDNSVDSMLSLDGSEE